MKCDGKNHNLREILRSEDEYEGDAVAKWCDACGAIVVDLEYDGRIIRQLVEMKFPDIALEMFVTWKQKETGGG